MIKSLKTIYRRQTFFPGWLGIFVNPFYFARSGLRDAMTEFAPMLSGRLLDVGCGSKPYQALFTVYAYIGLDIDSEASRKRALPIITMMGIHSRLLMLHSTPFFAIKYWSMCLTRMSFWAKSCGY